MSRHRREDRTQEVIGSIPFSSTTQVNDFRNSGLAIPSSPTKNRICRRVAGI